MTRPRLALAGSAVLAAGAIAVRYAIAGYHPILPALLLAAVILATWSLRAAPTTAETSTFRLDATIIAALLAVTLPLYLWWLYAVPWQVNTDEVTIMYVARQLATTPGTDSFGLSFYFGFPAAIFVLFGRLGLLLGGIDLYHMRLLHALFGLGCVVLAYGLFRQFTSPIRAGTFAAILGVNHSLLAISRMAMRDNTGLFFELLALMLLARGIQKNSRAFSLLGGAAAGLTFYTYFPSRITLVIWIGTLGLVWLRQPGVERFRVLGAHAALGLLGWGMVAAPVLIASVQQRELAFGYQRQQFLFYPEGRTLEQQWVGKATPAEAWKQNIRQGLATFNGRVPDQGYIYPNPGHGFVDPLTGLLLWVGVVLAGIRIARAREPAVAETLALAGFLLLYLAFALVITKAPNYTRLLVTLPFVAWLAGNAVWWLSETASGVLPSAVPERSRTRITRGMVVAVLVVILSLNVRAFGDFAARGAREGNDVGSTGRLIEARRHADGHHWVLAAGPEAPYYSWGESWQWLTWMEFFAGAGQSASVVTPSALDSLTVKPGTTILTSRLAWLPLEAAFRSRYTVDSVISVVPDGHLLAIEVGAPR